MLLRSFLMIFALFALVGCKGFLQNDIDRTAKLSNAELQRFQAELQKGYLELAQSEVSEDDFPDTSYFLRRSKALLQGGDILPTGIEERHFTPENEQKARRHREALIRFLDGGARIERPDVAARTQVMFDCWVQELEENRQPDHISICEEAFKSAMGALQGLAYTDGSGGFNVFFPFDRYSSVVDKAALDSFVNQAANSGAAFILITSHADSSGDYKYNYQLSKKRGEYIRDRLIEAGIDAGIISIVPLGEKNLPVATGDGVKEPGNRRAIIQLRY